METEKKKLPELTVDAFRKAGYRVKVRHSRWFLDPHQPVLRVLGQVLGPPRRSLCPVADVRKQEGNLHRILPCGGETVVSIIEPDGKEVQGRAGCLLEDQFCYRKGVQYAFENAYGIPHVKTKGELELARIEAEQGLIKEMFLHTYQEGFTKHEKRLILRAMANALLKAATSL